MHVEKKGKWKGILAAVLAVVLALCTYLTLSPGSIFLPGLRYQVCAVTGNETGLRAGSAVTVRLGAEPYVGALAIWRSDDGRWLACRVTAVSNGQAALADGSRLSVQGLAGVAGYEIFGLGACIDALSHQPGRSLVWAADMLYILGWCVWGMTLPGRRRRRRRSELLQLFEQYGAQYDLEEEGVEY